MYSMVSIIDWLTLPLFFRSALDVNRCSFLTLTISPAAAFPNAGIQLKGGKSFPSSILNAVASDFSKLIGRNSIPRRYISAATSIIVALSLSTTVRCFSAAMRASSCFCDTNPFRITVALKAPPA